MSSDSIPTPTSNAAASSLVVPVPQPANMPLAVVGGAVAALGGAATWAAITVATEYQIGYMAVGVGFLVGFAVRFLGRGSTQLFGVIGAVFSLLGCLAGNLFSGIGFISASQEIPFFDVLSTLTVDGAIGILKAMSSFMDVVLYAIAVYCGFKYSMVTASDDAAGSAPSAAA